MILEDKETLAPREEDEGERSDLSTLIRWALRVYFCLVLTFFGVYVGVVYIFSAVFEFQLMIDAIFAKPTVTEYRDNLPGGPTGVPR